MNLSWREVLYCYSSFCCFCSRSSAIEIKHSKQGTKNFLKIFRGAIFLLGCLTLLHDIPEYSIAQGGGPSGSYSQTQFDDSLSPRSSADFKFWRIDGPVGALLMVVTGFCAFVAAACRAYRKSIWFLAFSIACLLARATLSYFFGYEFQSYEE